MAFNFTDPYTRREFLRSGVILASAAITVPSFISGTASAMSQALGALSSLPGVPDDHVLVVLQLSGGNDGLNTVVPYGHPEYYRARAGIGIAEKDVLKLSRAEDVGLHPGLAGMRDLYDAGLLSIIQGVGYPNPNRSHFKSMDIWHTADPTATGDGWLGRFFDSQCCGFGKGESGTVETETAAAGPAGIAVGRTMPLAMQGRSSKAVSFENADLFKWSGKDVHEALREPYDHINRRGEVANAKDNNLDFLVRTALDAQVSSDMIRRAVALRPSVQFPQSEAGRQLSMVASMIRAGLKTKVYYVSQGGFDTHAGQGGVQGNHARLLAGVGGALKAFYDELKAQGNDQRVLTMTFSEFGRRVGQNASGGTDHGTAAPMFLAGPMVKPGVLNAHPSMRDLDGGDLKYTTDFRSVYTGVLANWLKADSSKILDGEFRAFDAIKTA
jgi:uncharacterized protein (DUF1501 family)